MEGVDFTQILVGLTVLLFSLTVHEAAHAWTADRLGDPTARLLGRISLNPVVHIDPVGTILFPLIAMFTNLPIIGWAKPVPVNLRRFREPRRHFMLVAAAGPASNLVLAVAASAIWRVVGLSGAGIDGAPAESVLTMLLLMAIYINVLLALFNMIPVPPLDGGNVLAGLLPPRGAVVFERMRPWGFLILYGLMLSGVLSMLVLPPMRLVLSWLI